MNPKYQPDIDMLSPLNLAPEALGSFNIPKKITLVDATIREGEQGTAAGFTLDQKKEYVRKAAAAGVELIQVPLARDVDALKELINFIHEEKLPVKTEILSMAPLFDADGMKKVNDMMLGLGVDYIDVMSVLYKQALPLYRGAPPEALYMDAAAQIAYIKSQGGHTSYDVLDTPRTDINVTLAAFRAAVDAGTDRLRVLDTNGAGGPAAWRYIVQRVKAAFPEIPLSVHCHNDFGQAMANVFVSLEEGAEMVDVCSNGIGERAGNACLQVVAAAAEMFYGIDTNIDLGQMRSLAIYTSDMARIPIDTHAPIIGATAFAHGDDGHYQLNTVCPGMFQAMNPATFGNTLPVSFGHTSGTYTARELLHSIGYSEELPEDTLKAITDELHRELTIRHSALSLETIHSVVVKYLGR